MITASDKKSSSSLKLSSIDLALVTAAVAKINYIAVAARCLTVMRAAFDAGYSRVLNDSYYRALLRAFAYFKFNPCDGRLDSFLFWSCDYFVIPLTVFFLP